MQQLRVFGFSLKMDLHCGFKNNEIRMVNLDADSSIFFMLQICAANLYYRLHNAFKIIIYSVIRTNKKFTLR